MIEQRDALEFLRGLEPGSVDLVLTDPPYNISRKNFFHTMGRAGIDFGEWDREFDQISWLRPAFDSLKRGGSLVVFNDWRNLGDIAGAAEELGFETKDVLRLRKSNPMPRNRDRRYITDYELALWLVKPGAKWTFNRQDESYQRPEFVCSIDRGLHPTQKPLAAMVDLVLIHSNEGDLVVDPFAGSGTTGVAAVRHGRRFSGCDLDESYVKIACERLCNEPMKIEPPVRLCCGERHLSVQCPDTLTQCCLCWERFPVDGLSMVGGAAENVCLRCAEEEERNRHE